MPIINRPNQHFDATLYTGTGSTQSITNAGAFKPDFVWVKRRSSIQDNVLFDAVRGTTKWLVSNATSAEGTYATSLTAFNSDGFTLGGINETNASSSTYVGWQWKAGEGTTTVNTSGTISSNVSVNATAGFSVVTYTGNGTSSATVGHGLGVTPKMIVYKRRNDVGNWIVYHTSLANNGSNYEFLEMNTTEAKQTVSSYLPVGGLSSTTFMTGTTGSINASGGTYVAYCWAEIAGFSSFGSYVGNFNANGPFVYTGFRPKFILGRDTSVSGQEWFLYDTAVNTINVADKFLSPTFSQAESTFGGTGGIDFLSNGFKIRAADNRENRSSSTYIYMAFAENPFKFSNAR
jgi:hypothetical protein